jgi:dienelactone hydrolase
MAADKGDELIKIPKRSFPSYISAATFMDDFNTPSEYGDFFGFNTSNPGITKIHCPILVFFGTRGDVGDEAELDSLQSCIKKHPAVEVKVTTILINNAEHMYVAEERQVAETITKWADDISKGGNNK